MDKLAQIPIGSTFDSPFGQTKMLGSFISLVLSLSFSLSGILILILLIFAGWSVLIGAGQNNPDSVAKGKNAAGAAAVGFVIIFVAYWIVRLIETITGANLFITAPFAIG